MLPDGRPLGAHLPTGAGMVRTVERAHQIGAGALQIFTDNPAAWRRRAEPPDELEAFRASLAANGIGPVAIHASYLINLAGPEPDLHDRSIALLAQELAAAPAFGARFVNIHIGSHRGTSISAGVARLASGLVKVLATTGDGPDSAILILENSAGGGFGIGTDVDELAAIAEAVEAVGIPTERVGFCLDTAHAWGAGIDVSNAEGVDALVDAFDRQIGLERLAMIHLNDSRAECGSRVDRHEHLGAGRIGGAGLARVLTHARLAGVATFIETPGMDAGYDAINLERARALAAGRPLADLPAEAFDLPSSRSRIGPKETDAPETANHP